MVVLLIGLGWLAGINNGILLIFGKLYNIANNTNNSYTLCNSYKSTFVTMCNPVAFRHWATITSQTLSTIQIYLTDISNNVGSDIHYFCIGY